MNELICDDIINLIKIDGLLLADYKKYQDTKSIVWLAVEENGLSLQYASDRLKDDFDIVTVAITNNGQAYQYASERLKKTKIIMEKAYQQNPLSIRYFDDKLITNEMAMGVVQYYAMGYKYLPNKYKNDLKIATKAILIDENVFFFLPKNYQKESFFQTQIKRKYAAISEVLYNPKEFIRMNINRNKNK